MMSRVREDWKILGAAIPLPREIKDGVLKVSYPGFCVTDFYDNDEKGVFIPEKFAKIMESSRALMYLLYLFRTDRTLVVVDVVYLLHPELHCLTDLKMAFPFMINLQVCHLGTSSCTLKQDLCKDGENAPLATSYCTIVYVDWRTRKPVPIPDEIKQSVPPAREAVHSRVSVPAIPSERYCYEVVIQPSDMDYNLHANQAVYIRLCSDAAASAQSRSFYRGIRDIAGQHLLEMRTVYRGESLEGDVVSVYTWQNPKALDVIHFVIRKENTTIFYCLWKLSSALTKASL